MALEVLAAKELVFPQPRGSGGAMALGMIVVNLFSV
jgi:hypothetical protein